MSRGSAFAELGAFAAVAELRSFRRAATKLGVTPSALSHTIRALEERLGVKLLNRTTRSVSPTEAGATLHARLATAFAEVDAAVAAVGEHRERPAGRVRICAPKIAVQIALAPVFARFARTHPEIRLEVSIDDNFGDVVADGFDAGIRSGPHLQRDMVAVRITPDLQGVVVASPTYLASHGTPMAPEDLRDHRCINYRWTGSGAVYRWPFVRDGEAFDIAVDGPLVLDDIDLMIDAAVDGVGLSSLLEPVVADHVAAGRLVRVLESWCRPFQGFFLYYPGRRQVPPALRALIDFLRVPDLPHPASRFIPT